LFRVTLKSRHFYFEANKTAFGVAQIQFLSRLFQWKLFFADVYFQAFLRANVLHLANNVGVITLLTAILFDIFTGLQDVDVT
jgi:small basic protein